jgi:hypothetical protein
MLVEAFLTHSLYEANVWCECFEGSENSLVIWGNAAEIDSDYVDPRA